ncbi:MAG: aspartyl protease family protein [Streptosporangiaceae bacterium]
MIIELDAEDADFAAILVDAVVAGRPYRLLLDTGAARTQLRADDYTSALRPVGADESSASFGGSVTEPVVTVTDLALGSLRLASLDVTRGGHSRAQVLGMDVLGRYRCHFRLEAGVLELDAPPGTGAGLEFMHGPRGHVYLDVHWPGVTARACWDTGAGVTVVDHAFWLSHPELFEQVGANSGTDANGDRAETPLLLMAGPVIGQCAFERHKAVAVDLRSVAREPCSVAHHAAYDAFFTPTNLSVLLLIIIIVGGIVAAIVAFGFARRWRAKRLDRLVLTAAAR